jgi:hypothetical protein
VRFVGQRQCKSFCAGTAAMSIVAMLLVSSLLLVAQPVSAESTWDGYLPEPGNTNTDPLEIVESSSVDSSGHMEVSVGAMLTHVDPRNDYKDFYDVTVRGHFAANTMVNLGYSMSTDPIALYPPDVDRMQEFTLANDGVIEIEFPKIDEANPDSNTFVFPYFGKYYDRLRISENGFVVLGDAITSGYPNPQTTFPDPSSDTPQGVIAPLWRDFDTGPRGSGVIYCGITNAPSPYSFTIVWEGVEGAVTGKTQSFALSLHGDGTFDYDYWKVTNPEYKRVKKSSEWVPTIAGYENTLAQFGQVIDPALTDTATGGKNIRFTPLPDNNYVVSGMSLMVYPETLTPGGWDYDPDARVLVLGEETAAVPGVNVLYDTIEIYTGGWEGAEELWGAVCLGLSILVPAEYAVTNLILDVAGYLIPTADFLEQYDSIVYEGMLVDQFDRGDTDPAVAIANGEEWALKDKYQGYVRPHDMYLVPEISWRIFDDTGVDARLKEHRLRMVVTAEGLTPAGTSIYTSAETVYTFNSWNVPSEPEDFVGSPDADSIELDWSSPEYTGGGIDHYEIHRKTATSSYSPLCTVDGDLTFYDDHDVVYGQLYSYRVYAVNVAGTGPSSLEALRVGIGNTAPDAYIDYISPPDPVLGQVVTFSGHGVDPDSGGSIIQYVWYSNQDGYLGFDDTIQVSDLSLGTHSIMFQVMDCYLETDTVYTPLTVSKVGTSIYIEDGPHYAPQQRVVTYSGTLVDQFDNPIVGEPVTVEIRVGGSPSDPIEAVVPATTGASGLWSIDYQFLTVDYYLLYAKYAGSSIYLPDTGIVWQIIVHNIPSATIESITPNPAVYLSAVSFDGSGTDPDGNPITAWEWVSDKDGFLSNEEDFSKSDLSFGTHVISFRVMDTHDAWSDPVTDVLEIKIGTMIVISDGSPHVAYDRLECYSGYLEDQFGSPMGGEPVRLEVRVGGGPLAPVEGVVDTVTDGNGIWTAFYTFLEINYYTIYALYDGNIIYMDDRSVGWNIQTEDPPVALIDSFTPDPGVFGQPVAFEGSSMPSSIGWPIIAWEWTSSLDGVLSNQEDFSTSALSLGTHIISFRVQEYHSLVWSDPATGTLVIDEWYGCALPVPGYPADDDYVNFYTLEYMGLPGGHVDNIAEMEDRDYYLLGVSSNTYVVGDSGEISISGWYSMYDTFPSYYWEGRRHVWVFVLDEAVTTILAQVEVLHYDDDVNTWIRVDDVRISGLTPGSTISIAVGREDSWDIMDRQLVAEWAGVEVRRVLTMTTSSMPDESWVDSAWTPGPGVFTYLEGESVGLTAAWTTVDPYGVTYIFSHWLVNGLSHFNRVYYFAIDSDTTVVAVYHVQVYP